MKISRPLAVAAVALAPAFPAAAQEFALKGGAAFSHFDIDGNIRFTENFLSTSYGGHYRLKLGPAWVQPEVHLVTRGGAYSPEENYEERLRLEYLELPLLLVLPARIGSLEPYAFGGPLLALETRCRLVVEEEGLKTNLGCDALREDLFNRRVFDWGVAAGAGIGRQIGAGKLMLEGRHTWGLRDISDDGATARVLNRTILVAIGYTFDLRNADR